MRKSLLLITIGIVSLLVGCETIDYGPEITSLQEDIQALQIQISEDEDYDDTVVKADIAELQTQITDLLTDITTLSNELDNSTLEQNINELEQQVDSLQTLLSEIEGYDDTLVQEDITELENSIAALENSIVNLDNDVEEIKTDLESLLTVDEYQSSIGPEFSNIPGNQMIEYQTNLNLLTLGLLAYDNVDGFITTSISVNIDDTSVLAMGNHPVTYTVTDSDGNTKSLTINLEVVVYESDFTFRLINNLTEIEITGFSGAPTAYLTIPETIGGLQVTSIGAYAFNGSGITSLDLPNNLEEIGVNAFFDNSISVIDMTDCSIHTIGNGAFRGNSLTSILVPDGVTMVGQDAFRDNVITEVFIGSTVSIIGNDAFSGNSISSIYIFGNDSRFDANWEAIGFPIELQ